jgi:hypothetical protein
VKEAATVIALMKEANPAFVKDFMEQGGFRSARTVAQLANHYRRLVARGDMAATRGQS